MKRWQIFSSPYAPGQRVGMGLPPASITGVCGGGILPEHGRTARISTVAACATESIVMSMRWHLLCGQGGLPNSASKTTPQPANPRRTPLCHPDHHLKRKERRQVVGLLRTPFKRMAVGLGTARSRCTSGLGINPLTIASPFTVIFCRHINSVPMCWYLLNRQGRFADSASKTYIFSKKQITGGYYV